MKSPDADNRRDHSQTREARRRILNADRADGFALLCTQHIADSKSNSGDAPCIVGADELNGGGIFALYVANSPADRPNAPRYILTSAEMEKLLAGETIEWKRNRFLHIPERVTEQNN